MHKLLALAMLAVSVAACQTQIEAPTPTPTSTIVPSSTPTSRPTATFTPTLRPTSTPTITPTAIPPNSRWDVRVLAVSTYGTFYWSSGDKMLMRPGYIYVDVLLDVKTMPHSRFHSVTDTRVFLIDEKGERSKAWYVGAKPVVAGEQIAPSQDLVPPLWFEQPQCCYAGFKLPQADIAAESYVRVILPAIADRIKNLIGVDFDGVSFTIVR